MRLMIFIPTYQRPDTLTWSIESVLRQKFQNKNIEKQIIVINNDLETKEQVRHSVNQAEKNASDHSFGEIKILEGDASIPVIKRIYGSINELTLEGDVTIVHCDDDIMLPDTLEYRYNSVIKAKQTVCIAKAIGTCYFFRNKKSIYLGALRDPLIIKSVSDYSLACKEDLTSYSIPFLSVYAYKSGKDFLTIYEQAIKWADELPFPPKIKYPFVPFFIGLSAYYNKQLCVSPDKVVIRGQLFEKRGLLPPRVVTEYANTGIILQTGLAVLNNRELKIDDDYEVIRNEFKKNVQEYLLQSTLKRDGVSIKELNTLLQLSNAPSFRETIFSRVIIKNLRNLFNNIVFDTRYLKKWIKGWGEETTEDVFWKKWAGQG